MDRAMGFVEGTGPWDLLKGQGHGIFLKGQSHGPQRQC